MYKRQSKHILLTLVIARRRDRCIVGRQKQSLFIKQSAWCGCDGARLLSGVCAGSIPKELGGLDKLEVLRLALNKLTGTVWVFVLPWVDHCFVARKWCSAQRQMVFAPVVQLLTWHSPAGNRYSNISRVKKLALALDRIYSPL